jgi:hypothetical protein
MTPASTANVKKPSDNTAKILDNIALTFENEDHLEKDLLKEVLESIVKELSTNSDRTHQVDMKLVSKYMIFEK